MAEGRVVSVSLKLRRGATAGGLLAPAGSRGGSVNGSFGAGGAAILCSGTRNRWPQAGHFATRRTWFSDAFSVVPHAGHGNRCHLRSPSLTTIANPSCVWPYSDFAASDRDHSVVLAEPETRVRCPVRRLWFGTQAMQKARAFAWRAQKPRHPCRLLFRTGLPRRPSRLRALRGCSGLSRRCF